MYILYMYLSKNLIEIFIFVPVKFYVINLYLQNNESPLYIALIEVKFKLLYKKQFFDCL